MHGKLKGKILQLVTMEARQFQQATLAQLAFNEGIGFVHQMVPGDNTLHVAPLTVYQAAGDTSWVGFDEPDEHEQHGWQDEL